jgi:integrase
LLNARAPNTNKAYNSAFAKWVSWTRNYSEVDSLPANPLHIVLYLLYLARTAASFSVINLAICSISWAHRIAGLSSPTTSIIVAETLNGLKRKLAKPAVPKDPFSLQNIISIINIMDPLSLKDVRNTAMIVLGFYALLRVDELRSLRGSCVILHSTHLELSISQSKCDQLRQGSTVVIAKLGGINCPVVLLLRYLSAAGIVLTEDMYVFRRICAYSEGFQLVKSDIPLSYSLIRDAVKFKASQIGLDKKNFSTHSMRSGGASAAAAGSANERLLQRHGRWATAQSRNRYVKDSLEARLEVSKSISISTGI